MSDRLDKKEIDAFIARSILTGTPEDIAQKLRKVAENPHKIPEMEEPTQEGPAKLYYQLMVKKKELQDKLWDKLPDEGNLAPMWNGPWDRRSGFFQTPDGRVMLISISHVVEHNEWDSDIWLEDPSNPYAKIEIQPSGFIEKSDGKGNFTSAYYDDLDNSVTINDPGEGIIPAAIKGLDHFIQNIDRLKFSQKHPNSNVKGK